MDMTKSRARTLGIEDLISLLGVPRTTVFQLMNRDTHPLPAGFKIGKRRRWLESQVVQWLEVEQGKGQREWRFR